MKIERKFTTEATGAYGAMAFAITTSEIKISVVIDEKHMELAVNALHKAFGLDKANIESE